MADVPRETEDPIRDQYFGDDGLTDVQRAMKAFGASQLEYKWPSEIAAEFVAYQREWGFCDYPYWVADLNDELMAFCDSRKYLMQDLQQLREAISAQPGVSSRRVRLSKHNPQHRFIRQRLAAKGSTNDRPVLYFVSSQVPTYASDLPPLWHALDEPGEAASSPPLGKSKKGAGRPGKGKKVAMPRPTFETAPDEPEVTWERRVA